MDEDDLTLFKGVARLVLKRTFVRTRLLRENFARSRIEFLQKHKDRIDRRIEKLEAGLPKKRKKRIRKINIE